MSTAAPTRAERRWKTKAKRITYRRPWLYPEQEAFLFTPARYSIVEATTKSGKTTGCLIWLHEKAVLEGFDGWNGWWVAPTYGQARIAYTRLKRFLKRAKDLYRFNDGDLTVRAPNGALLAFKSAEKPDNLYGDDVYAAVLDEASRMRETAWHAIRSTLTATRGPVRIIGNVKGRKNWYYKLARLAQGGAEGFYYAKLTAYHAVTAGILARAEVEDARRVLPEAVFRELYLAEPSEDGSNPFGLAAIRRCLLPGHDGDNATPAHQLGRGPVVAHGIDLAKSIDWTVDIGLTEAAEMAAFDRWQSSWEDTTAKIARAVGGATCWIDSTGVGDPIVETLSKGRDNYTGYKFTAASKQRLMEGLALAIQSEAVRLYAGPGDVLLNELEAFEFTYTRTGVRYSAPEGMHDDCVVALALAVEAHRHRALTARRGARLVTL